MAVRSRLLLPDIAVRVASGEMEVVSRQAVLEAVADAVITQELAGGFISVAVQRQPTGAPNEMVTVSAMVEWKDRSDAKTQPETRANPEVEALAILASMPEIHEIDDGLGEPTTPGPEAEPDLPVLPFEHVEADSPDGLDESKLEEEDIADLSEATR